MNFLATPKTMDSVFFPQTLPPHQDADGAEHLLNDMAYFLTLTPTPNSMHKGLYVVLKRHSEWHYLAQRLPK